MRDFRGNNRLDRGGDRDFLRSDSRRSDFRNNDGPREMFPAVCDECGKDCQVPFRPSNNKPIFCSDCFEKQGGGIPRGDRDFKARDSFSGGGSDLATIQRQFGEINRKLSLILEALEPKKFKPVYNKADPVKRKPRPPVEK